MSARRLSLRMFFSSKFVLSFLFLAICTADFNSSVRWYVALGFWGFWWILGRFFFRAAVRLLFR